MMKSMCRPTCGVGGTLCAQWQMHKDTRMHACKHTRRRVLHVEHSDAVASHPDARDETMGVPRAMPLCCVDEIDDDDDDATGGVAVHDGADDTSPACSASRDIVDDIVGAALPCAASASLTLIASCRCANADNATHAHESSHSIKSECICTY